MIERPLLSIVIPTRNRADYAVYAAGTAMTMQGSDIEILLHDNGEDERLAAWVAKTNDPRLRHVRRKGRLSMRANYDAAIAASRGEYLAVVGDDDGVLPYLYQAAQWAQSRRVDLLLPSDPCHYVWPDLRMKRRGAMQPGELKISLYTGAYRVVDPAEELGKCLRSGCQKFHLLPRLYYGLVSRRAIDRVHSATGFFVPSLSPDMACSVALATLGEPVHYVDFPLFLPGSSGRSNAGQSGLRRHVGLLERQAHLSPEELARWSPIVPRFYSVQTIWAEAGVQALRASGRAALLREFDVPAFFAECLFQHWRFADRIFRAFPAALSECHQGRARGYLRLIGRYSVWWLLRMKCFARRFLPAQGTPPWEVQGGLENVLAASLRLVEVIASRSISFPLPKET